MMSVEDLDDVQKMEEEASLDDDLNEDVEKMKIWMIATLTL